MINKKPREYKGYICTLNEDEYKREVIILSEELNLREIKENNQILYQPLGSLEKYELINWKDKTKRLKDLELKNYVYIPELLNKYEKLHKSAEDKKLEKALRKVRLRKK